MRYLQTKTKKANYIARLWMGDKWVVGDDGLEPPTYAV
jgi:hypothetical protein